jgi:type II secretory ATPase GspE/PulE/Tfp pilus assembly ATPase PilB-like protein
MGIEPFLITSTVVMSIAQRLIRKICPNCKESYEVETKVAQRTLGLKEEDIKEEKITLYRGKGCEKCYGVGYRGRTGVFELMVMTDTIKTLVLDREPTHVIREAAEKEGMVTLRQAGLSKVLEGITTVDELLRITFEEKIAYQ